MTNEKTLVDVLEEISTKKDFIFTLAQTAAELTNRAKVINRPNELENFTASGYELHRVSELLENINHMIIDLNEEADELIKQALQTA